MCCAAPTLFRVGDSKLGQSEVVSVTALTAFPSYVRRLHTSGGRSGRWCLCFECGAGRTHSVVSRVLSVSVTRRQTLFLCWAFVRCEESRHGESRANGAESHSRQDARNNRCEILFAHTDASREIPRGTGSHLLWMVVPPGSRSENVDSHACAAYIVAETAIQEPTDPCHIRPYHVRFVLPFVRQASGSLFGPLIGLFGVYTKDVHSAIFHPPSKFDALARQSRSSPKIFPTVLPADLCLALPLIQSTTVLLSPSFPAGSPCLFSEYQEPLDPVPMALCWVRLWFLQ